MPYEPPHRGFLAGTMFILMIVLAFVVTLVGFSEVVSGALVQSWAAALVAYWIGTRFCRSTWVNRWLFFAGPIACAALGGGLLVFSTWFDRNVGAGIVLGAIVAVSWAASGAAAYGFCAWRARRQRAA